MPAKMNLKKRLPRSGTGTPKRKDVRTILASKGFQEWRRIEYDGSSHSVSCTLFDDCEYPEKPPWQLNAAFAPDEWLAAVGDSYLNFVAPRGVSLAKRPPPTAAQVVAFIAGLRGTGLPHLVLDSFSVIEAGEQARRYDREVKRSPLQDALLKIAKDDNLKLEDAFSPRAFETLVAHALRAMGFERVVLKRYSKDGGIDIFAIIAEGIITESVIVEVKHQSKPCGLKVLDRLNGVRDRENASRALLVCSGIVTRDAKLAYRAKADHVSAVTLRDLLALVDDVGDWSVTPSGLWTKAV